MSITTPSRVIDEDDPSCPRDGCGFTSDSVSGVKRHYGRVHDGSLAGVAVKCDQCNVVTEKDPYRLDRSDNLFCSTECHDRWRSENVSGSDAGGWDGGHLVSIECDNCGDNTEKRRDHAEKFDRSFCDRSCFAEHRLRRGVDRDVFDGRLGTSFRRRGNWSEARNVALERDDHRCWFCGLSDAANTVIYGKGLEVHHVTRVREFVSEDGERVDWDAANNQGNLLSLCSKCHTHSIE